MNLGKYVGNTVIITVVGIVIDVVFSAMCDVSIGNNGI